MVATVVSTRSTITGLKSGMTLQATEMFLKEKTFNARQIYHAAKAHYQVLKLERCKMQKSKMALTIFFKMFWQKFYSSFPKSLIVIKLIPVVSS